MIEPKSSVAPASNALQDLSTDGGRGPTLQWKRVSGGAMPPVYQSAGSAGMDLCACVECKGGHGCDEIRIEPGAIAVVPTGWAVAIPTGFEGQVRPRSGLATRYGVTVPNAPGTIDSDYRGEVKVALINLGKEAFVVTNGMRIAQLVIAPVARAEFLEVLDLEETRRGAGGFGSTGL